MDPWIQREDDRGQKHIASITMELIDFQRFRDPDRTLKANLDTFIPEFNGRLQAVTHVSVSRSLRAWANASSASGCQGSSLNHCGYASLDMPSESMGRSAIDIRTRTTPPRGSCQEWKHLNAKHGLSIYMDRPPAGDAGLSAKIMGTTVEALRFIMNGVGFLKGDT